MTFETFLDGLDRPRRTARGFIAHCPAHEDRSASLSVSEGDDGRILIKDFSGCTPAEIVAAMGLKLSDLFPENQTPASRARSRQVKHLKQEKARLQKIDTQFQGVFREAETTLEAAKGIDISGLSEEELDAAMNALGDAYEARRTEDDERRIEESF